DRRQLLGLGGSVAGPAAVGGIVSGWMSAGALPGVPGMTVIVSLRSPPAATLPEVVASMSAACFRQSVFSSPDSASQRLRSLAAIVDAEGDFSSCSRAACSAAPASLRQVFWLSAVLPARQFARSCW